MARQVYFSFHYQRDIQRANVVRNSHTIRKADEEVGYFDHSLWEEAKTKGDDAVRALIDGGMSGASVTVALIGAQTYDRKWVLYEIAKSHNESMGLVGINLNNIPAWDKTTEAAGPNPFDQLTIPTVLGGTKLLSSVYPVYDWVHDDGYNNASRWIETAAQAAGR